MRPFRVGKAFVPTPWGGDFSNYESFTGHPHSDLRAGVVELPEGRFVYWAGQITALNRCKQPGAVSTTYAVKWREPDGRTYLGRLSLGACALGLEGRRSGGTHRLTGRSATTRFSTSESAVAPTASTGSLRWWSTAQTAATWSPARDWVPASFKRSSIGSVRATPHCLAARPRP